jgi:hypothetical protein
LDTPDKWIIGDHYKNKYNEACTKIEAEKFCVVGACMKVSNSSYLVLLLDKFCIKSKGVRLDFYNDSNKYEDVIKLLDDFEEECKKV